MSPLILVRGLRYRYDDGTLALNGVDFRLEKGETVALLGANGSGKTTFALHLNGLLSGEGTVEVCGLPVNPKNIAEVRRKIGLVFQDSEPVVHAHRFGRCGVRTSESRPRPRRRRSGLWRRCNRWVCRRRRVRRHIISVQARRSEWP